MTTLGPRSHLYEVNAMLRVSERSEDRIRSFFSGAFRVKPSRLQSALHLTVYHGRRPIPGLREKSQPLRIVADTIETRFMVLVPGGENPRDEVDPRAHSIGIRLTKRNAAIPAIQRLREQIYRLEAKGVVGTRKQSTAWTNSFGSRAYQPHIQLLRPWHKINATLTEIGALFRDEVNEIEFDSFQVEARHRVDGQWVVGSMIDPSRATTQLVTDQDADQLRSQLPSAR